MFTKSVVAVAAVAGLVSAAPAAVTSAIAPKETTPAGCSTNYDGTFEIQVINVTSSKTKRDSKALISTLKDGVLTDDQGRIGYIASNNQFQYDGPPQAGAIYTAGFSVCQNGSLALGNSAIFYQCLSGTFYNLYDENTAAQCSPVYIEAINQGKGTTTANAKQIADGQVTASPVSDVACQIGDGQLQKNTCTGNAITQIADGQIQAPTGAPVTQIGDGQIQAPTTKAAVVSQITDGQIQAPTGAPVTQIGDGQIQAPTGNPVTQIGDGQIQAPTNATVSTPTVVPFTGAASSVTLSISALVAGVVAVLAL